MSEHSTIEWTDATWNPVRGCTKITPGCDHCYAETFAERFRGVQGPSVRARFRSEARTAEAGRAAALENAQDDLRELDERPVPQGRTGRIHRGCLSRDGTSQLAYLPGAHQAVVPTQGFARDPVAGRWPGILTSGGA